MMKCEKSYLVSDMLREVSLLLVIIVFSLRVGAVEYAQEEFITIKNCGSVADGKILGSSHNVYFNLGSNVHIDLPILEPKYAILDENGILLSFVAEGSKNYIVTFRIQKDIFNSFGNLEEISIGKKSKLDNLYGLLRSRNIFWKLGKEGVIFVEHPVSSDASSKVVGAYGIDERYIWVFETTPALSCLDITFSEGLLSESQNPENILKLILDEYLKKMTISNKALRELGFKTMSNKD